MATAVVIVACPGNASINRQAAASDLGALGDARSCSFQCSHNARTAWRYRVARRAELRAASAKYSIQRCTSSARQPVIVDCVTEILEQSRNLFRGWRNECGPARIVVVPADPVLLRPKPPGNLAVRRALHESLVNLENVALLEFLDGRCVLDRQNHGVDVRDQVANRLLCL